MKKRWVATVVVLVAAGGWYGTYRWQQEEQARPEFEAVPLVRERLESAVDATGVVEPRNRIEIKPPIGGRIDEILVEEGQVVRKGDIIAWMSSTERAALLDAARAQGEAVMQQWENVYRPTPFMAPLDGTIIARKSEPGQTVTAADVVLVLSDRLIVKAEVDETDIGSIYAGQETLVRLDAYPDVSMTGVVQHIAYEAETVNNVTIYEVDVEPQTIPDCMKSGMTVSARFVLGVVEQALVLASDAVTRAGGEATVLVDDGNPATPPEARRVETGLASDGRIEIRSGLKGDEQVVRKAFVLPEKKQVGSPLMPARRR
jgi:macrolide-specific efflux system membrane fusion protein